MLKFIKVRPAFKFWLETEKGYVFGEGPFKLLTKIREIGTLSGAAKALEMSYRHAWGLIREVEGNVGKLLLKTHKGGKHGGGGANLTQEAMDLLTKYETANKAFSELCQRLSSEFID